MPQKAFWRGALIFVICAALATPAAAGSLKDNASNIEVGIVVVAAAAVVGVVLLIHYSKKRTIAGCVASGASGMTITDEKDQRVYALSGNTTGVAPGERVKLRGKKLKSHGTDNTPTWEATTVAKDFGVCHP